MIGGLALACYGSTRATADLDLLIRDEHKEKVKDLLLENGFRLVNESMEVLQFAGLGYIDVLLARRPISQKFFPTRELQDKASKIKLKFLEEYFKMFDIKKVKRKMIKGDNFKL